MWFDHTWSDVMWCYSYMMSCNVLSYVSYFTLCNVKPSDLMWSDMMHPLPSLILIPTVIYNFWPEFLFGHLLDSFSSAAASPPYPQSLSKPHASTLFEVISIHQSSFPGPTLTQPSAHLFLPPRSHPNPSHSEQLWSPLDIFHPVLTQLQFNPHLNLISPTSPLSLLPRDKPA